MMVGWVLVIALGLGALYGLHRLALWMEEHGYIYYLHKKPKGGSAIGSLVAFQRAIEPRAEYVIQAEQVNQEIAEEGASGQGDLDGRSAKPCDDGEKQGRESRTVKENGGCPEVSA
jgi:hypothetical protein